MKVSGSSFDFLSYGDNSDTQTDLENYCIVAFKKNKGNPVAGSLVKIREGKICHKKITVANEKAIFY